MFFTTILLEQSRRAIRLLSEETIEHLLSPPQLAVWQYVQTVPEASPREIAQYTGIPRPTINQIIDKLLNLNKIEKFGMGRATRYRKNKG